ncbi:hypothetical protein HQ393_13890 [Chitinibacter bivalviorum]|uniref:Uncharacterized protein n=1 Tax=Chitinibacter bivalviorum TaxID=2739434 RepID=A0A7H9BPG6_9NEIS|nr:hypothetical protein [Chitinibacter bivalviorum]QLG89244.1 hypothetical protein HQ393_13890 [Chitinibacter bivalviorum]
MKKILALSILWALTSVSAQAAVTIRPYPIISGHTALYTCNVMWSGSYVDHVSGGFVYCRKNS